MAWPTSSPSWVIFNKQFYGYYHKLLAFNLKLFNEASNGALLLSAGEITGDFETMAFLNRLNGLVRDRDPSSDADVAQIDFNWDSMSKVKIAKGTPPVNMTEHFWTWVGKSPKEAAAYLANQLVEEDLYSKVQSAVGAGIAALTNLQTNSIPVVYDGTAGAANLTGLVRAAQLFGDRKSSIGAWIMHSKSHADILEGAIANATDLFKFGDINVQEDGFGRRFIVSDIPALTYVATGTKYRVLGLTPGAVIIEGNNDLKVNYQEVNGKENITATWQGQWTFNQSVKGMTWDESNGGRAPTLAELSTATNWDPKITSAKDGPGVMANFQ